MLPPIAMCGIEEGELYVKLHERQHTIGCLQRAVSVTPLLAGMSQSVMSGSIVGQKGPHRRYAVSWERTGAAKVVGSELRELRFVRAYPAFKAPLLT